MPATDAGAPMLMTQDERWQQQYDQVLEFMNTNHRRPSKHREEDRRMLNWMKHNKKLLSKGMLHPHRQEKFTHLLKIADQYRRFNQWTVLE